MYQNSNIKMTFLHPTEKQGTFPKPVENDDEPVCFHYVWIKDLSRLVSGQLSQTSICDRCLHYFRNEEKLITHQMDCSKMNECSITLLSSGNDKLKLKNFKHMEKLPFTVYTDFKCILKKSESTSGSTRITQVHEPCSVGYYVKCSIDENLSRYSSYRGTDPARGSFKNSQRWLSKWRHCIKIRNP